MAPLIPERCLLDKSPWIIWAFGFFLIAVLIVTLAPLLGGKVPETPLHQLAVHRSMDTDQETAKR